MGMALKLRIPARSILTETELVDLLNWELSAYDECGECRFTAVRPSAADPSGCNWSAAVASGETDARIVEQVVAETRGKFNLAG